jgi:hypothetical protein
MKVPTVGTSVFSPLVTTASDTAVITTNFPIDLQIGGYRASTNSTNNWNMFTRRIQLSTTGDNNGAGLLTSSDAAENTGLTYPIRYNNTGYQNYGSRTWSLNFRRAPQFLETVCYTGTGVARTINHNLTVVPELMIVKSRSTAGYSWCVYSAALGPTYVGFLNLNSAFSSGAVQWNSTTPTSSVFSVSTNIAVNGSGTTFVAHLFATCAGVSKVGSYTGDGTNGRVIDCGFTSGARFILIKKTNSTGDWAVWDTARGITSGNDPVLVFNSPAAEYVDGDQVDPNSTGFIVNNVGGFNTSSDTYIFLAIA